MWSVSILFTEIILHPLISLTEGQFVGTTSAQAEELVRTGCLLVGQTCLACIWCLETLKELVFVCLEGFLLTSGLHSSGELKAEISTNSRLLLKYWCFMTKLLLHSHRSSSSQEFPTVFSQPGCFSSLECNPGNSIFHVWGETILERASSRQGLFPAASFFQPYTVSSESSLTQITLVARWLRSPLAVHDRGLSAVQLCTHCWTESLIAFFGAYWAYRVCLWHGLVWQDVGWEQAVLPWILLLSWLCCWLFWCFVSFRVWFVVSCGVPRFEVHMIPSASAATLLLVRKHCLRQFRLYLRLTRATFHMECQNPTNALQPER